MIFGGYMLMKSGVKDKMFRATYDKRKINKTFLNIRKSFDEVKSVLNGNKKA